MSTAALLSQWRLGCNPQLLSSWKDIVSSRKSGCRKVVVVGVLVEAMRVHHAPGAVHAMVWVATVIHMRAPRAMHEKVGLSCKEHDFGMSFVQ